MTRGLRAAVAFSAASLLAQGLSLARTIYIARVLPLEQFGLAATFLLVVTLVEMATQIRPDLLMMQHRDGNSRAMQAGLQAGQALRGLLGALLLLALAGPLAWSFGPSEHPNEHLGSYRMLALIPLLGGLVHFDQHRRKRSMDLGPAALILVLPLLGSLLLAIGLSDRVRDAGLMLVALIGQHALAFALSHVLARRRYRWQWDPALMRRALRFGTPILANGALLFLVFNGERWIVGHWLGLADLAVFTLMLNLSMTPALVLAHGVQTWLLPQLARLQDDAAGFARLARTAGRLPFALAIAFATSAALVGPPLAARIAGDAYHGGLALFAWLALAQALRLAQSGLTLAPLASGQTASGLAGNLLRVACLPLGAWWLGQGGGLNGLAQLALMAEAAALAVTFTLTRRTACVPLRVVAAGLTVVALIALDTHLTAPKASLPAHLHPFQLVYLIAAGAALGAMLTHPQASAARALRSILPWALRGRSSSTSNRDGTM